MQEGIGGVEASPEAILRRSSGQEEIDSLRGRLRGPWGGHRQGLWGLVGFAIARRCCPKIVSVSGSTGNTASTAEGDFCQRVV